jgi:hypothetical protein
VEARKKALILRARGSVGQATGAIFGRKQTLGDFKKNIIVKHSHMRPKKYITCLLTNGAHLPSVAANRTSGMAAQFGQRPLHLTQHLELDRQPGTWFEEHRRIFAQLGHFFTLSEKSIVYLRDF